MRLFFFNKTRSKSGFFRSKKEIELNFYRKRSSILQQNRRFLSMVFNLHMIDFAVRLGSIIAIFFAGLNLFTFEIELWTDPLTIPASSPEIIETLLEIRLSYPIVLYKDGKLMSEGKNLPLNRLERLKLFRKKLNEEPRVIALLIIDQDTPMEFVYKLTEDLRIAGLYRIHFATGNGNPRNIR